MLVRLRRVRFPSSLEGYGPGRPSLLSAVAALIHSAPLELAPSAPSSAVSASSPYASTSSTSSTCSTPSSNSSSSPSTPLSSPSPSTSTPTASATTASPDADSSSPPSSVEAKADASAPRLRQKMPLGTDRRKGRKTAPTAGPSTIEDQKRRYESLNVRARKASRADVPLTSRDGSWGAPSPASDLSLTELVLEAMNSRGPQLSADDSPNPESEALRPLTIVHAALAHPNPPSPRALLEYVRERPQTYSLQAAAALSVYARRTGDARVQQGAIDLLSAMRVPAPRLEMRKELPLIDLWELWRNLAGVEPNTALLKRIPPIEKPQKEAASLLSHCHYLYLSGEAMPLATALKLLRYVGGTLAHEMDLLYLHLAYTAQAPLELLDEFQGLSKAKWTRQTLHLAVLSLLRLHRSRNADVKPLLKTSARTRTAPPTEPSSIMSDIRALIARFESADSALHRSPGPETWRHIAQYALETDDEQLAHLAFLGARVEHAADRIRDARKRARTVTLYAPLAAPGRDAKAAFSPAPAPKFLNLGRHLARWEKLLHRIAARGWAVRGDAPEDDPESPVPRLLLRWEWCGRAGEANVKAKAEKSSREAWEPSKDTDPRLDDSFTLAPDINVLTQHVPVEAETAHKAGRRTRRRAAERADDDE